MEKVTLTNYDIDLLDEAKLLLLEILNELKERGEYRTAVRINEIIGKIEAAKKEKKRLEARLRALINQHRQSLALDFVPALVPSF